MDAIKAELDRIHADLAAIAKGVHDNIALQVARFIPGVGGIVDWIQNTINTVEAEVSSATGSITTQIQQAAQAAVPDTISAIEAMIGNLVGSIQSVINNLATAEDFASTVVGVLKRNAPNLERWLYDQVTTSVGNTALGVLHSLELESPEMVDPILDELLKIPDLPPWMLSALHGARGRHAPFVAFILPALILAALLPALGALADPIVTAVRQGAFDHMPTKEAPEPILTEALLRGMITDERWLKGMRQQGYAEDISNMFLRTRQLRLDPDVAARARFRGHYTQAQYETELADRGMDPERAIAFFEAAKRPLEEPYVQTAWLRGEISDAEHDRRLGMFGVPSENAALLRKLYFRIPDPADLIHMAIRNVFSPEIVERFQLFGDFPDAFKEAAAHQGISEYWAKNYWGAHWIVPSNSEGFEMFQRTTDKSDDPNADTYTLSDGATVQNIIGLSTLQLLLREKDTAPYYRHKLTEIAYHPFTRIDVRRMHSVGSLTHAGVQRAYLDLGYSPDHALKLADYVVKLNDKGAKDRSLPLIDGILKRIVDLYVAEKLDLNDAAFAFADLGFTQDEAEHYLASAKMVQAAEDAVAIESGVGKLYVAGYIKVEDAAQRLLGAHVPEAAITRLFSKWDLEILYATDKRMSHATRDLSKTELLDAFKAGMISEPDVITLLDNLGYPEIEAEVLVHLAKFQRDKSSRTTQIEALKALYINGVRSPLDVSNALDQLGMLAAQRDAFLAEWELLREQRTEKLPLATLRDMHKRGIMDDETATVQLRRHRLSDDDISLLLRLWAA